MRKLLITMVENKVEFNEETSKPKDDTYTYTPFANLKLNESEASK